MITRKAQQGHSIREAMRGGGGDTVRAGLPGPVRQGPGLRSWILTLIPGASIGYHVHENETELFYFLEGAGKVRDDDEEFDIAAGDSMATFSGHGHGVTNTGDTDLVLLACIVKD